MTELPIELWEKIFKHYPQVEDVKIESPGDRLSVIINAGHTTLSCAMVELNNDLFYKGDPFEVADRTLKDYPAFDDYRDTLLAYFDIVAYSAYLRQTGMEEVKRQMHRFLTFAKGLYARMALLKIDSLVLSDSVILVMDTDRGCLNAQTAQTFLATCSQLMGQAMISHRVPLRGAIGGGDFYKSNDVLVSTALVDAVGYEKKQDWLGAVLTPNAVQLMRNVPVDLPDCSDWVGKGEIPWKNGTKTEYYYIKPHTLSPNHDWAKHYLPSHFDIVQGATKIRNSDCLYRKANDPNDSEKT